MTSNSSSVKTNETTATKTRSIDLIRPTWPQHGSSQVQLFANNTERTSENNDKILIAHSPCQTDLPLLAKIFQNTGEPDEQIRKRYKKSYFRTESCVSPKCSHNNNFYDIPQIAGTTLQGSMALYNNLNPKFTVKNFTVIVEAKKVTS